MKNRYCVKFGPLQLSQVFTETNFNAATVTNKIIQATQKLEEPEFDSEWEDVQTESAIEEYEPDVINDFFGVSIVVKPLPSVTLPQVNWN